MTLESKNLERLYQVLDVIPVINRFMLARLVPEFDSAAIRDAIAAGLKAKTIKTNTQTQTISLSHAGEFDVDRMIAYWIFNFSASRNTSINQMIGGRGESALYFQEGDRLYAVVILSTADCRSRSLRLSAGTLDGNDVTILYAFIAQKDAAEREAQIQTMLDRIVPPLYADYQLLAVDLGATLFTRPQITAIPIPNKERRL